MEQSLPQTGAQTVKYPNRYRPGRSGNPGGSPIARARLDAEIARLLADFGRKPNAIELALVRQLANVVLRRPSLDTARLASRIACQLGFNARTAAEADSVSDDLAPLPSGAEIIKARKVADE